MSFSTNSLRNDHDQLAPPRAASRERLTPAARPAVPRGAMPVPRRAARKTQEAQHRRRWCPRSIGSFNSGLAWLGACLPLKRLDAGGSATTRRDTSARALTTRSSALSSATVSQRCGDPRHAIDQTEAVGLSLIRFASFSFAALRFVQF